MSDEIRANTGTTLKIGPFLDQTNASEGESGEDIDQADVRLSKNGGNFAQKNDATANAPHDEHGFYDVTVDATDTNTPGRLLVSINLHADGNALPAYARYMVLTEHAYDMKYGTEGSGGGIQMMKVWYGTFAAADATTITMGNDAAAAAIYEGARVMVALESGTNCTGRNYFGTVGAARVITVDPAFSADAGDTPSGTMIGAVYAAPKSPTASVATTQLADGHLVAAKFGADCITAAKIADNAISSEHLATDAISADAVADGAITAGTLAGDCITAAKIADNAIAAEHLATDAITTDALADGTITAAKIGADAITNAKIANNAIAAENLATDAITTDTLADNTITNAKIANNAIAAENLAADAITSAKIADDAISSEHLNTGVLTASAFAANALVAATFATDSITSDAFAASAATKIIDDFETQSQADPSGFHVNAMEINSVDLTGDGDGTPIGAA